MAWRFILVLTLVGVLAATAFADKILFKDGSVKTVRIYKTAKDYVSYLFKGKIEVAPRSKIKPDGIKIEGKPLTDKELAEAVKAFRKELKKKLKEEETKNGVKNGAKTGVQTVGNDKTPTKGVKVIDKGKSKTKATELKIDPFPDHPTQPKTSTKNAGKIGKKPPAKRMPKK